MSGLAWSMLIHFNYRDSNTSFNFPSEISYARPSQSTVSAEFADEALWRGRVLLSPLCLQPCSLLASRWCMNTSFRKHEAKGAKGGFSWATTMLVHHHHPALFSIIPPAYTSRNLVQHQLPSTICGISTLSHIPVCRAVQVQVVQSIGCHHSNLKQLWDAFISLLSSSARKARLRQLTKAVTSTVASFLFVDTESTKSQFSKWRDGRKLIKHLQLWGIQLTDHASVPVA